jgi:hypothetical protein
MAMRGVADYRSQSAQFPKISPARKIPLDNMGDWAYITRMLNTLFHAHETRHQPE